MSLSARSFDSGSTLRIAHPEGSDEALVVACQSGDQAALNKLISRHRQTVYAILRRIAPDWSSSHDDMVQESMIKIFRSIKGLRNPAAFKGWLNQLVTNQFYDELRKKPKLANISIDDAYHSDDKNESSAMEIPDVSNQPEEVFHRKQIISDVNAAIAKLPDAYRNVIVLRELHGLEYNEIARLTSSELGTVKSRLARGRAKMQVELSSHCA